MNPDGKHERVRRCATCGIFVGITQMGTCPSCSGPLITLGPIQWTEEDEAKEAFELAITEFAGTKDEDEFQDIVCMLWDMVEMLEVEVDDRDNEIEELGNEIILHVNALKVSEKEIAELKAKLEDESLKGKVKKAFKSK